MDTRNKEIEILSALTENDLNKAVKTTEKKRRRVRGSFVNAFASHQNPTAIRLFGFKL